MTPIFNSTREEWIVPRNDYAPALAETIAALCSLRASGEVWTDNTRRLEEEIFGLVKKLKELEPDLSQAELMKGAK